MSSSPTPEDLKAAAQLHSKAAVQLDEIKSVVGKTIEGYIGKYNTEEVREQLTQQVEATIRDFLPGPVKAKDVSVKTLWSIMSTKNRVLWVLVNRFTGLGNLIRAWIANPPPWLSPDPRNSLDIKFTLSEVPADVQLKTELPPPPEVPGGGVIDKPTT